MRFYRLGCALLLCIGGGAAAVAGAAVRPAGYTDPESCTPCHARIAETYRLTGMARSFSRAMPGDEVSNFYNQASDTHYSMSAKGGKYFQRRWQIGFDGRETNVDEREAAYVVGSGNHARTWLARAATGKLLELPLGWYAEKGGYRDMNPGYDSAHPPSQRPISYQCMFCHNAYPATPVKRGEAVFADELPEGIDCQRCHGPGAKHVRLARTKAVAAALIRASIVNPARLPKDRQAEVCLQCHLETASGRLPSLIRRFSVGPFSYLPGQPLGDFTLSFDQTPMPGRDKFEIAGAAYRLRQSACFLKSNAALTCTTCHNPHDIPRGAAADLHYKQACVQCHSAGDDMHRQAENCTDCHMPKRLTDDAVHVAITDHRIVKRPAEHRAAPTEPYRGQVVPYYPATPAPTRENRLYYALAQVQHGSNLAEGIPLLSQLLTQAERVGAASANGFYLALGDAWRLAGEPAKALPVYARINSAASLVSQGSIERELGRFDRAAQILLRATLLFPEEAPAWLQLGIALSAQGANSEATDALKKSIQLDPDVPEAFYALGLTAKQEGEPFFRRALQLDPFLWTAHANLALLLTDQGRRDEAVFHFAKAARLEPRNAANHYEYALTLAQLNRFEESRTEAEAALRQGPDLAEAHELLGGLRARDGDFDAALTHYEAAVRIKPNFFRAQLDLGIALAARGDAARAAVHLRVAAKGTDPKIAGRAQTALRALDP